MNRGVIFYQWLRRKRLNCCLLPHKCSWLISCFMLSSSPPSTLYVSTRPIASLNFPTISEPHTLHYPKSFSTISTTTPQPKNPTFCVWLQLQTLRPFNHYQKSLTSSISSSLHLHWTRTFILQFHDKLVLRISTEPWYSIWTQDRLWNVRLCWFTVGPSIFLIMCRTFWVIVTYLLLCSMEDCNTKKKPESSQSSKTKTSKSSYPQPPWEWDLISNISIA